MILKLLTIDIADSHDVSLDGLCINITLTADEYSELFNISKEANDEYR